MNFGFWKLEMSTLANSEIGTLANSASSVEVAKAKSNK
jgi:hypothetical protein